MSYAVSSNSWAAIAEVLDIDIDDIIGMEAEMDANNQVVSVIIERETVDGESTFDTYFLLD